MYERFQQSYQLTKQSEKSDTDQIALPDEVRSLVQLLGGQTFNRGLYRIPTAGLLNKLNPLILSAFPKYKKNKICCFGYDWLGRCFAIDSSRENHILRFEHGTGEVVIIPCSIESFHNIELVEDPEPALSQAFFAEWLDHYEDSMSLDIDECAGYTKPLFLGGEDNTDNLEVSDLEVYIDMCGQIRHAIEDLPAGSVIRDITIE